MGVIAKIKKVFISIKSLVADGKDSLDDNQKKSLSFIAKFFALMVIFTIIARGTSSATLPVVETKKPTSNIIKNVVETNGIVKSEDITIIKVPNGVRIEKALVQPGAEIKEGDPILSYSKEEIDDAIVKANLDLKEIELNMQELHILSPYDGSGFEISGKNLDWDKQDLEDTKKNSDISVKRAEEDYIAELRKLEEVREKRRKEKRELGYSSQDDESDKQYKEQIKAAEESVESARRRYYDAQISAGKTVTDAERAIIRSELSYEASIIQNDTNRAQNSVANSKKLNSAEKLKLDQKIQINLIDTLKDIVESDYKLTAPASGRVVSILMLDGIVPTGDGKTSDYLKMSKRGSSLFAEIEFDEKDAKTVKVGSKLTVFEDSNPTESKVRSVALPNENKKTIVTVTLEKGNWTIGNTVKIQIPISENKHQITVPLSAIYQDNLGYYVYTVEESNGILGAENKAVMQRVTLVEKDKEYAAVSGPLYQDNNIIVSTTKPLNNNTTVRVAAK